MTDRNDSLVAEYLERVSRATAGLPAEQRDELNRDLREHIETSRAELPVETEAQVRGILERLGDPAVIARAAAQDAGLPQGDAVGERPAAARRWPWLVAVIVLVLLFLAAGAFFFAQNNEGPSSMGPSTEIVRLESAPRVS